MPNSYSSCVSVYFDPDHPNFEGSQFKMLRSAFARAGWTLADDGTIAPVSGIDITTGGRDALDEQLGRLRRNTNDPGALLGTAKDMLEAVAKFVLEELDVPVSGSPSSTTCGTSPAIVSASCQARST